MQIESFRGARLEGHIKGVASGRELYSLPVYTTKSGESKPAERQLELIAIVGSVAAKRAEEAGISEPVELEVVPLISVPE
jgi:hypothetical protein